MQRRQYGREDTGRKPPLDQARQIREIPLLGLTAAKPRGYLDTAFHLWIKPITKQKNE